jgi:hypothetical protein
MRRAHPANPPSRPPIAITTKKVVSLERLLVNLSMGSLAPKPGDDGHEQQHQGDDGAGLAYPHVTPKLVHSHSA